MLVALVVAPLALALLAFALPSERWRPWLVPAGGLVHFVLTLAALRESAPSALGGWLAIDPLTRVVLPLLSSLFLICAAYAPSYLRIRPERPNRVFCTGLLVFLGMMTLITESHHLGLMWVALEFNTLASAPLLYFNQNPRSLEATWKYLMIGAVGIALALLGSFFLAYAALSSGLETSLLFDDLVRQAPQLSRPWLHAAFVLLFVGYGTKMGIAPMHTWKPDAYGEAPGLVGALLAGGLTTCAFVALLRFVQICGAAGEAAFASELLVATGLLSMAIAGVFMARQRDFKRMLAYSSVEHMGILALGVGIGGLGTFGALLHVINNAFAKGVMFLSAGNIHRAFGSKTTDVVAGALRRVPVSAALFLAGFFAVTGSPPFGPFVSEFTILRATIENGRYGVAALFLVLLFVVFVGMGATVLAVVQGDPRGERSEFRDRPGTVLPIVVLIALVLLLGLWIPNGLDSALWDAARFVEARP
ncbi:MAG TPA: proton-conducting transporter membrane subunit [Myxococcota bacterium]|nr:proton-conducting transporter membrane subunit [Myxococcota bacterium]